VDCACSAWVAGVRAGTGISAAAVGSAGREAAVIGLPHSGQKIAGARTAAPHDEQRVEISGCMKLL
jgi:hypothetical protein